MRRFLALLHSRNKEFFRDRSALGWNLAFPVLLIIGFALAFSGEGRPEYKIGVYQMDRVDPRHPFLQLRHVDYVGYADLTRAIDRVRHHKLTLLVDLPGKRYWTNSDSPKGYLAEQLLQSLSGEALQREPVSGRPIRYVDWVLPGILGMNMMFSALFGVGYVIVRYRKNGVLKRLQATPLSALEFLTAQVASRLVIMLCVSSVLYLGCAHFIDAPMRGSYLLLLLIATLGAMSLISLGLVIAARTSSEEYASGALNLLSWPMMFLSGVWFSLEGSPAFMQQLAQLLPLTHLVGAARAVMNEGAGLVEVLPQLTTLALMSLVLIGISAWMFRWHPN